ncbi:unnamed protein product [Phyllotreta striolata]|uniref:Uncharacterized protein n=1 Tax=Phyllotreta striolata TaxID=444603 RepID=A0A9N9TFY6_PHYSR|nr:unnamed protein product [Phyllotreta striolata]
MGIFQVQIDGKPDGILEKKLPPNPEGRMLVGSADDGKNHHGANCNGRRESGPQFGFNEQRQQQRTQQIGGGFGLKLDLGVSNGMFSRTSQNEQIGRSFQKRSLREPKKCFVLIVQAPPQVSSSTGASIDPRGQNVSGTAAGRR